MFTTVYLLRDPRTSETKYVGVTDGRLSRRLAQHYYSRDHTRRGRWTAELEAEGLRPIMEVIERVPCAQRDEAEKRWIKHFRDEGIDLLNHNRGGKGFTGPMSEEQKRKLSDAKRGKPMVFRDPAVLKARNAKVGAIHRGKPKSVEHRAKLAAAQRGRSQIPPHIQEIARKLRLTGMSVRSVAMQVGYPWDSVNRVLNAIVSGTGRELSLDELR